MYGVNELNTEEHVSHPRLVFYMCKLSLCLLLLLLIIYNSLEA